MKGSNFMTLGYCVSATIHGDFENEWLGYYLCFEHDGCIFRKVPNDNEHLNFKLFQSKHGAQCLIGRLYKYFNFDLGYSFEIKRVIDKEGNFFIVDNS